MATYSFNNVQACIVGPGGSFSLGYGAGVAEEGITVEMTGEKDVLTIGADGTPMHTLLADKSGKATVRLLKVSPVNAQLQALYDAQSLSASLWGQNIITVTNSSSGDVISCRSVAFAKSPAKTYAKEPGVMEWEFNCGQIDSVLGTY
jgi:Bacteriophage KPP10, Structural protein ORF10